MRLLRYGSTGLLSEYCPHCGYEAFVIKGRRSCCGRVKEGDADHWKQMSVNPKRRRPPPLEIQRRILAEQGNLCFYCDIGFDTPVYRHGKQVGRAINWDHFVPYQYARHNESENYVASCSICNRIKSDLMFKDSDECRNYIALRWRTKCYTVEKPSHEVRTLRDTFPS